VGGRVEERAGEIQAALRIDQLAAPDVVSQAMGATVAALVAVIAELNAQIGRLEEGLADRFEKHPAAKVIRSLPGLGMILGARVLGEFGDDPNRYADAKSRKTTPARHLSLKPPANARWSSPGTPGTGAWPTPATCGLSPPSPPARRPSLL